MGRSQGTGAMAANQGVCSHCVSLNVSIEKFGGSFWSVLLVFMHKTARRNSSVDHNVNSH